MSACSCPARSGIEIELIVDLGQLALAVGELALEPRGGLAHLHHQLTQLLQLILAVTRRRLLLRPGVADEHQEGEGSHPDRRQ